AVRVPSSRLAICSAGPLWMMALWNSPFAAGKAISTLTLAPPPLSPKIVTLPGSPPKRAILSRTHSSAATMSRMPAVPAPANAAQGEDRQQVGGQAEGVVLLHGHAGVSGGIAHAAPRRDRVRRPPAQRPERRRGIGDALEDRNAALGQPDDAARSGFDDDPV